MNLDQRLISLYVDAKWYGVRFLDISPDAEKALEAFVDANASKSRPGAGDQRA